MGIIYKLKWGSSILRRQQAGSSTDASHHRIINMLLTVSFTWFFLTLPVSLLGFVPFLHDTLVARSVCFLLMYTNHSINFYLYCLTGKKFRQELKEVFKCSAAKRGQHHMHNGGETSKSTGKTDINEKIPLTSTSNQFYTGGEGI